MAQRLEMKEIQEEEDTTTGGNSEEAPLRISLQKKLDKVPWKPLMNRYEEGSNQHVAINIHGKKIQHVAINIDEEEEDTTTGGDSEDDPLRISLQKKLDKVPGKPLTNRDVTIFRVPTWFHETNKYLWEPTMVSIGPYYHGKESLQGLEEHKLVTLRDFLARKNVTLEVCLREIRAIEAQARLCYSETVKMGTDDFVMILLLDGCFILELLTKWELEESDSICDVGWEKLFAELLLLENQVPFIVIQKLFFIQDRGSHICTGSCPLLDLIHCREMMGNARLEKTGTPCNNIQHLLHYYYTALLGSFEPPQKQTNVGEIEVEGYHCPILCASELHEAGVKFRWKEQPAHTFDISFKNGILEIPSLIIDHFYYVVFWNMVAFEQSQKSTFKRYLSSYFAFMDALVSTQKDVVLLQRFGIVDSFLESDEDAAAFFNQFEKHFFIWSSDDIFNPLKMKIKAYSESTWHKYRARLNHDYFSNPWSVISLGAATVLLILTFMQTIYSAK